MFAAIVVVLAFTGIWERVLALPCLGARTTVLASQVQVLGQVTTFIYDDDDDVVSSELLRRAL